MSPARKGWPERARSKTMATMTTARTTARSRARSFDSAAALYGQHRPGYPEAVYDTVEELAGRRFAGARVADVGAGTGIGTAPMRARGAEVVAVEPGDGMAAEFRRGRPGIPLVRGDGDRLPLAGAAFDFLTYAQAWHWTDPARSVPEARRVLKPGGALAIWWNDLDESAGWVAAQGERIHAFFGADGPVGAVAGGAGAVGGAPRPWGSGRFRAASTPVSPRGPSRGPGGSRWRRTWRTWPAIRRSCCWARRGRGSSWAPSGSGWTRSFRTGRWKSPTW